MKRGCPAPSHSCIFLIIAHLFGLRGARWARLPVALFSLTFVGVASFYAAMRRPWLCAHPPKIMGTSAYSASNSRDLLDNFFIYTRCLGLKLSVSPSAYGLW